MKNEKLAQVNSMKTLIKIIRILNNLRYANMSEYSQK